MTSDKVHFTYMISDTRDTLFLANDLSLTPNSLFGHYLSASAVFLFCGLQCKFQRFWKFFLDSLLSLKNSKCFPHLSAWTFSVQLTHTHILNLHTEFTHILNTCLFEIKSFEDAILSVLLLI